MSTSAAAIDAAAVLRHAEGVLAPWVASEGGEFSIAYDPHHALEMLGNGPRRFRVVLAWDGYEALEEGGEGGIVDSRIVLLVQQNPGLPARTGLDLSHDRAGDEPILCRIDAAIHVLRTATPAAGMGCRGFVLSSTEWLDEYATDPARITRTHRADLTITHRLPGRADL